MDFLPEVSGLPIDAVADSWVFDSIEEWVRRSSQRPALILQHDQEAEEFTYADLLNQARWMAAGLVQNGIQAGDRVGILMENIPQWVFALFGALRLGAITVPLATALPEAVVLNLARHAGCKVIFADAPNLTKACNVAASLGIITVAWQGTDSRAIPWDSFQNRQITAPLYAGEDPVALIIYTSGTTGDPKGVQLTVRNLIYEIRAASQALNINSTNCILSVLPFSHVLPLIANALGPLCLGARVVFLSSISPQRIVEAFHQHRINCFVCVPQFFYAIHKKIFAEVQAQPWLARKAFGFMLSIARRVPSIKFRRRLFGRIHRKLGEELLILASGGSRFDADIARDFNLLGYSMINAYGLTETCAAVTSTVPGENAEGTVGKPVRGISIRIDSPNNEGIGEIAIRGPMVMKGYYLDPAHTAEVLRDGWFYTGDLGFIRSDGNLTITGRSKEIIVLANGKNIYPEEIEAHYAQSPLIKEICVLGIPDSSDGPGGEKLHAVVVPELEECRRKGLATIQDWIRFDIENLSRQLPTYQRVLSLSVRNEPFPRTVTRKLKRFEIQQEEIARRRSQPSQLPAQDNPLFKSGVGAAVAALVRKAKPAAPALTPELNLELDLGFDSLTRVEMLAEMETQLGVHVDESDASRIYTLAELIDAFENPRNSQTTGARHWSEILAGADAYRNHYIFNSKPLSNLIVLAVVRTIGLAGKLFFHLKGSGLEKLPSAPYLLCPNHESFLDAPMLYACLPSNVIRKSFGLGYSNYWAGTISSRIARNTNIVALDASTNLVRGLQISAAGLKGGKILVLFPEGTRSVDGHIADFKKGAAILSYELSIPIVPVGINGTFESWPRVGPFKLHPIEVVFGDPIRPEEFVKAADPYAALTDRLRNEVKRLTREP